MPVRVDHLRTLHPDVTQPTAIISSHEGRLHAALPDVDSRTSLGDLCANPKVWVEALMLKDCNAQQAERFKSFEFLQAVVLTADEWAPESRLVTAVRKIQQKTIGQRYCAEISVRFFLIPSSCCAVSSSLRTHARGLITTH